MKNTILTAIVMGVFISAHPVLASTPDGLLTSKTKLALWTTAGVRSGAVHVDSNDGVVTLHGKVPTDEQRSIAEKTARGIAGVKSVKSLLQVVPEAQEKRVAASDKEIMKAAEQALKAEPTLKDSSISLKSVDKGVALLSGEARTISDHLRAVVVVDRVPGVRRVSSDVKGPDGFGPEERVAMVNRAQAKGGEVRTSASDMRISVATKLRLLTAAEVPSTEISVDTNDGVVTLFGIVPTEAVRKAAGAEAGKVSGVTRVENNLEVVPSSEQKMVEAKDADIARDLALAFKGRADLKGVDTSVKNGTVRLTGTVASGWDEISAVRVARQVAGVRGVENQVKVED